jgi:hypothetical protein
MHAFRCFLGSTTGFILTVAVAALGVYLLWNHSGHLLYAAPYLVLLLCPLMHLFGHGHAHGEQEKES